MAKEHVLFIVMQERDKAKAVLKKLEEIGVPGATAIDTRGAASLAVATGEVVVATEMSKTVFSVVPNEEIAMHAMDEVEKILEMDPEKPGKGIMFTIPLVGQMGLL